MGGVITADPPEAPMPQLETRPAAARSGIGRRDRSTLRRGGAAAIVVAGLIAVGAYATDQLLIPDTSPPDVSAVAVPEPAPDAALLEFRDSIAEQYGGAPISVVPSPRALREARDSLVRQYGSRPPAVRPSREPSARELREMRRRLARQYGGS